MGSEGIAANASDYMITESLSDTQPSDSIRIAGLRLSTRIGVPDSEREVPQSVEAHITMMPRSGNLAGLGDAIESTIDYYEVAQRLRQLAATGERKLIESLAEECSDVLLAEFPVRAATVEIRKFVVADTGYVAVTISKEAIAK
ncbi:MAG: dihydroneopterin aldolase [Verrucomicrobia bacterium]|nr:dihydroneopterin aldolase [Verrucomicrobiota bacterium]